MIDPPTLSEIRAAADRLREVIVHTPLVPLHNFDRRSDILLKPEIHQAVTSFKIRGVFNAVASLDPDARAKGLSTVSAGNTAQALAWVGRHFGVPSRSLMPNTAPSTKIEAVKLYGGKPVLVPMIEVFRFLKEHLWEREPYAFIHPWTNRNVMIGHGSIGLEIMDDLPAVQTVFVPVVGGGVLVDTVELRLLLCEAPSCNVPCGDGIGDETPFSLDCSPIDCVCRSETITLQWSGLSLTPGAEVFLNLQPAEGALPELQTEDDLITQIAPGPIPTVSAWGLIALTLLIVSVGSVLIRRRGVA